MKQNVGTEQLLGMLHQAIVPPARPGLVLLAWRWRYELVLLAGLLLALVTLVKVLGPKGTMLFAVTAVIIVLTVLIGWSAARRRLAARAWCILTPHRLRAGCAQARIYTRRGRLPAILWCAPTGYGEQVLIWCPAGVTTDDFAAARQVLVTACYAAEIEVVTHPRYRHLVVLSVIRNQRPELRSPDDAATRLSVPLPVDSDSLHEVGSGGPGAGQSSDVRAEPCPPTSSMTSWRRWRSRRRSWHSYGDFPRV